MHIYHKRPFPKINQMHEVTILIRITIIIFFPSSKIHHKGIYYLKKVNSLTGLKYYALRNPCRSPYI